MTSGERLNNSALKETGHKLGWQKKSVCILHPFKIEKRVFRSHPQKCLIVYVIYSTPRPTIFFAEPMKNLLVFMAFRHMSRF